MELEIVSREIIKPSSPTPSHPRTFNFCYFDKMAGRMYVPVVLFYNPAAGACAVEQSNLLKKSLSETLALYYPFAGRVVDAEYIDCTDEGVTYLEAKIHAKLSEVLRNPDNETLDLLFADNLQWEDTNLSTLLAVQVSYFECGGMAISMCMSHKLGDAATLITFIKDWAAMASNSGEHVIPLFDLTSMFPQDDLQIGKEHVNDKGKLATRRFVFDALKIAALKAIVAQKVYNPTKVEVVTALLFKCASSTSGGRAVLCQNINLRSRLVPPMQENFVGNLAWFFPVPKLEEDGEIELPGFVGQMKEALAEFCNTYASKFRGKEWCLSIQQHMKKAKELYGSGAAKYICSSWCRLPIYEVDFGWGKPVWARIGSRAGKNVSILLDTRSGDGIEAFVTLEEQDMAKFERNEELLAFATFNPNPVEELS